MFLEIENLLTPPEIAQLRTIAQSTTFIDGKISNPHNKAKNNLQIDQAGAAYKDSSAILLRALQRNEVFREFAFPKLIAPPMLCQYEPGMHYGAHSDTAIGIVQGRRLRFDVSCTIFISDPGDYEGGELTIHLGSTPVKIKGRAGSAIVYPSSTIHEVAPVSAGRRLVAITFIESDIRDPAKREIVHLLNEVHALEGERMEWKNRTLLQHVQFSLYRMWSE